MASPCPNPKRRDPQPRAYSHALCKSLLFALFLLSVPLFPSQAPDFVRETVLTKLWELLHLLFIGIAVSYGLFSRRNVGVRFDANSTVVEDSQSYMSRMFNVSSSVSYACLFDDKKLNSWVSASGSVVSERRKPRSLAFEDEHEEVSVFHNVNEVQAWNSEYFQGESLVVVAQPNSGVDAYIGHKPLGLPVRSLRSGFNDDRVPEAFSDGIESVSSAGHGSSKSSIGSVNSGLDHFGRRSSKESLSEASASSSAIPWHTGPERISMRENARGNSRASHFRPLSVDETQFESLKARSLLSTASFSSQGSSMSQNQSRFSPANSVSSLSSNSKVEDDLGTDKSLLESSRSPSPPQSPSPPKPRLPSSNIPRHVSHSRHFSHGSMFDEDLRKSFEDETKGLNLNRRDHRSSRKDFGRRILKVAADESRLEAKSFSRSYSPDPSDGDDSSTSWHSQPCSRVPFTDEDVTKSPEGDYRGRRRRDSIGRSHHVQSSSRYEAERRGKDDSFHGLCAPTSPSPLMNGKSALNLNAPHDSCDDLLKKDVTGSLKGHTEDLRSRRKDYSAESKELKPGSLRWESNPRRTAKASPRGRSVRTWRGGVFTKEPTKNSETSDNDAEDHEMGVCMESEAGCTGKSDRRSSRIGKLGKVASDITPGYDNHNKPSNGNGKLAKVVSDITPGYGSHNSKAIMSFENNLGRGEKILSRNCAEGAGGELEGEVDQLQMDLEKEASTADMNEEGNGQNEVDRKAGEFIAKFREQIRLQKQLSADTPRSTSSIESRYFM